MARYKPGSLDEAVRNICADYIAETFSNATQFRDNSDIEVDENEDKTDQRGSVKDPEHDRRLKQNRNNAA